MKFNRIIAVTLTVFVVLSVVVGFSPKFRIADVSATSQPRVGDVDNDGDIGATDALLILHYVVGKITVFPSEQVPEQPVESDQINFSSIWAYEYTADDANALVYQRAVYALKEQNKITTSVQSLDSTSAVSTIVNEVMAGKSTADVYEVSLSMCRDIAKAGAAANIFDSSTLNKELYTNGETQSCTFGGKAYGVSFNKAEDVLGVLYNKDLVSQYAPDYDIMQLYKDKRWTFEKFQQVAKACTVDADGDGVLDVQGFTSNTHVIGMAQTANAGGAALMVNGKVEATLCNEAGIKALEWCKELLKDKSWLYKADINQCVTEFNSGKAAMFVSYLNHYISSTESVGFEVEFVPMPMGPDQTEYISGVSDAQVYVVPISKTDRLDVIGTWLNGMAGAKQGLLENKKAQLAQKGLSEDSINNVLWVTENKKPEYSTGVFEGTGISESVDSSVVIASKQPQKEMYRIKSRAQALLDDYYAPLY